MANISISAPGLSSGGFLYNNGNNNARLCITAESEEFDMEIIKSWQEDEELWQKMLGNLPSRQRKEEALSQLRLTNWVSCGYGLPTESQADLATAGAVCQ